MNRLESFRIYGILWRVLFATIIAEKTMPDDTEEKRIKGYLKMRDVCAYLSVTAETISKWIRNKGMPAHKIGKEWLFSQQEIDEWVVGHNGNGETPRKKR